MNTARRNDIQNKLILMGRALVEEGEALQDFGIIETGANIIFLSTLMTNDDDMFLFSQFTGMFSAKKVLDTMNLSPLDSDLAARFDKGLANIMGMPQQPKEEPPIDKPKDKISPVKKTRKRKSDDPDDPKTEK